MITKPCNKPGCTKLIPRGKTPAYCDDHRKQHHKYYDDRKDPKIKAFYSSARWTRLANLKREQAYYLCDICCEPGRIVHHKVEIRTPEGWEKRFDLDGMQLICNSCHEKIHDRFS